MLSPRGCSSARGHRENCKSRVEKPVRQKETGVVDDKVSKGGLMPKSVFHHSRMTVPAGLSAYG